MEDPVLLQCSVYVCVCGTLIVIGRLSAKPGPENNQNICVFPAFKVLQTKVDLSRAHRADSEIFMKTVGLKYLREFAQLEQ